MRNVLPDRMFYSCLDSPDVGTLMGTGKCEIAGIKVFPLGIMTN